MHYDAIQIALPKWRELVPDAQFRIGFYTERAPESFLQWKETIDFASFVPITERAYGLSYNQLVEGQDYDALIVLAPFVVPYQWLFGSAREWLSHYSIVGHYKPPRVLVAENIYLPLISPVIVELGRLNLDCLLVRDDVTLDFSYREFLFGSVLVRGRPGAYLLFNALHEGKAVMTLPPYVRMVKYLSRKKQDELNARRANDAIL